MENDWENQILPLVDLESYACIRQNPNEERKKRKLYHHQDITILPSILDVQTWAGRCVENVIFQLSYNCLTSQLSCSVTLLGIRYTNFSSLIINLSFAHVIDFHIPGREAFSALPRLRRWRSDYHHGDRNGGSCPRRHSNEAGYRFSHGRGWWGTKGEDLRNYFYWSSPDHCYFFWISFRSLLWNDI